MGLAACGGGEQPAATPAPQAPSGGGEAVSLNISSKGDTPFFETEVLEAKAGSRISLTLANTAPAGSSVQFNWVLVKPGTVLRVVTDGQSEGSAETSYIKPNDPNVIAFTKLVGAGQSDTVTFDAPPPGEYPFVSTFPGYYNKMKGVLTIK